MDKRQKLEDQVDNSLVSCQYKTETGKEDDIKKSQKMW